MSDQMWLAKKRELKMRDNLIDPAQDAQDAQVSWLSRGWPAPEQERQAH